MYTGKDLEIPVAGHCSIVITIFERFICLLLQFFANSDVFCTEMKPPTPPHPTPSPKNENLGVGETLWLESVQFSVKSVHFFFFFWGGRGVGGQYHYQLCISVLHDCSLYRLSDASGSLTFKQVKKGSVDKGDLDTKVRVCMQWRGWAQPPSSCSSSQIQCWSSFLDFHIPSMK